MALPMASAHRQHWASDGDPPLDMLDQHCGNVADSVLAIGLLDTTTRDVCTRTLSNNNRSTHTQSKNVVCIIHVIQLQVRGGIVRSKLTCCTVMDHLLTVT